MTSFAPAAAKQVKAEIVKEKQEQSLQVDRPIENEVLAPVVEIMMRRVMSRWRRRTGSSVNSRKFKGQGTSTNASSRMRLCTLKAVTSCSNK